MGEALRVERLADGEDRAWARAVLRHFHDDEGEEAVERLPRTPFEF